MSNNPFSVPDSPPALIDPPKSTTKSRTKKSIHMLALVSVVVVWYGPFLLNFSEAPTIAFSYHGCFVISILLKNEFTNLEVPATLWTIEVVFLALLAVALLSRSFMLTLGILAFSICWTVTNYNYALNMPPIY